MVLLFASISFIFAIYCSTSTPQPPTHSLSAPLCISLPPFFSSLLSHPLHLSFSLSIFAWLSVFSPALHPALSFPAKRLAGVFSTVVTFKTECHHCLLLSLILPSHLSLSLPPPSLLRLPPPSSSCSEGLLDQVLCLGERLALIQLSSVCVWAVRVFCMCWRRRLVKYGPFSLLLTSAAVYTFGISRFPSSALC